MSIAKKIFIISSILFATVLFFMGIYNISFKDKKSVSQPSQQAEAQNNQEKSIIQKTEEKLGIKNTDKIYPLTKNTVISPVILSEEEKIKYYESGSGSVYEVSFDGGNEKLLEKNNFGGLENILWSPDRKKVISLFNNNGKREYSVYDYEIKKATKLAEGTSDAVWDNSGSKIFYKYADAKTGKKTVNVANPDGTEWKKIADISGNNTEIAPVPQSSFVSFWNIPNSLEDTSLNIVSTLGGETRKIFSGKFGADYLWSPNGTKTLVSYSDSKGGSKISLAVINSNGGEFQNLNIPTLVSKCVWSSDNKTVYYALPSFPSESHILPNDYQNKKISSKDTFWKMDITTGKTDRIVDIEDIKESLDATNLFLSPAEDILFFVDRNSGRLYGINL